MYDPEIYFLLALDHKALLSTENTVKPLDFFFHSLILNNQRPGIYRQLTYLLTYSMEQSPS